jgi:metallo-beta-lactamase class B
VGAAWAAAWALQTSDGVILLDALNNAAEAATLIEGGMKHVGLDPASIKTLVVSHAHGDHYGGAPYLIERYHPRVVMSERDWTMIETRLEFASPLWGAPPKRDQSVNDGDRVTLGDTTVTLYLTQATMGTLTPVFDVKDGATTHRAMLWGGTAQLRQRCAAAAALHRGHGAWPGWPRAADRRAVVQPPRQQHGDGGGAPRGTHLRHQYAGVVRAR